MAAVAVALAAPAHADTDGNFLMDIKNAGISFSDSSTTVTAGKTVCKMLDAGSSDDEVVTNLEQQNPGFTHAKAQTFESMATSAYCPPGDEPAADEPAGPEPAGEPGASTGTGPPSGTTTH